LRVDRYENLPDEETTTEARPSPFELSNQNAATILGEDQPRFRVTQIKEGLFKGFIAPWDNMTLPKNLRSRLRDQMYLSAESAFVVSTDQGRTRKAVLTLRDDSKIETVLMRYRKRDTVCVSTQVGCAMGCVFCATGQGGFGRHLRVSEMQEQFFWASKELREIDPTKRITNVVLMGMGEPLANYDNTLAFVRSLILEFQLGARSITLSTVGVVPGILKLAEEDLQVNLAVSLHAPDNETRDQIVPINRRYSIDTLIDSLHLYRTKNNRRVTLEYALIDKVNDSLEQMRQLTVIAKELRAHVNLIPLNSTPMYEYPGSPPETVARCKEILSNNSVNVTVRDTRGSDIAAACGQLVVQSDKLRVRRASVPTS
jgi:23S rRNA (adenine2503-C2)-methyltransferase